MGIPYYFASLIRAHKGIVRKVTHLTPDVLAIDFNCLIHTYLDDTNPIESVVNALRTILDTVCTAKTVYIAMDGLVPYSKIVQQRYRRFRKSDTVPVFDRHQISPETPYMKGLATAVRAAFPSAIVSDTSEPGEGEHKLFAWARTLPEEERKTMSIYGLDADLILLSLLQTSLTTDLTLLRESKTFNQKVDGFTTLSVHRLAERLPIPVDEYIRLCVLCFGNDFMPTLGMFSLRYGGHDRAISLYQRLGISLDTFEGRAAFIEAASAFEDKVYTSVNETRSPAEKAIFAGGHLFSERYCCHILDGVQDITPVVGAFWKTYHWTMSYFTTNTVPDWGWVYPYPDAPLVKHMVGKIEPSIKWSRKKVCTTSQQLHCILPSVSLRTAKKRVQYPDEYYDEEKDMRIPWMKRYAWESEPRISIPWNPTVTQTTCVCWKPQA